MGEKARLGFESLLTIHQGKLRIESVVVDGEESTTKSEGRSFSGQHFDLGPRAAIFYELSDRWTLEANCYQGLFNVQFTDPNHRRTFKSGIAARFNI